MGEMKPVIGRDTSYELSEVISKAFAESNFRCGPKMAYFYEETRVNRTLEAL